MKESLVIVLSILYLSFQYYSPQDKSGSIRARAVLLNPTHYFATYEFHDINEKYTLTNESVVLEKFSVSVNDNTEFERGNFCKSKRNFHPKAY